MQVRVTDVKKWAGREQRWRLREPWAATVKERVEHPPTEPAEVDVWVRNTGSLLVCQVSGVAEMEATCVRCLAPFHLAVPFDMEGEFREGPAPATPSVDDFIYFTGDQLPLDDLVADAVALAVPMAPLCHPGCRGLCPQCGANLNHERCGCREAAWDQRWAGLEGLVRPSAEEGD